MRKEPTRNGKLGDVCKLGDVWGKFLVAAKREYEQSLARPDDQFPHFTEEARWRLLPADAVSRWLPDGEYEHGNWTSGFWFGSMWLLILGTRESDRADFVRGRLKSLEARASDNSTHDLGFLFFPSYVLGHRIGLLTRGDAAPAVEAARMIAQRFNARGGYIQAFGAIGDHRSAGTSTIDTMVNLPLLWWAARATDPVLFDIARVHARTSSRLFVREDGSTYHLNRYDPISGALLHRGTFQGASDESCWSRGQAWGVCGFAWAYAATGESELLGAAERTARYFWNHLPDNGIPPWDFSDGSPGAELDASASAVAALGALILGRTHPDERHRARYWRDGSELLRSLAPCINQGETTEGILLRSCYSKPQGLGVNSATAWGDFFFGLGLAVAVGAVSLPAVLGFDPQSPGTAREDSPLGEEEA